MPTPPCLIPAYSADRVQVSSTEARTTAEELMLNMQLVPRPLLDEQRWHNPSNILAAGDAAANQRMYTAQAP